MLLETHKVFLSTKSIARLKLGACDSKVSSKDERINFSIGLRMLQPNMELDEPLAKEWLVTAN